MVGQDVIRLLSPAVEEIKERNPLRRIELVGRTCYASLHKMTDTSAEPFVRNLMARGHETPLEAARIEVTEAMVRESLGHLEDDFWDQVNDMADVIWTTRYANNEIETTRIDVIGELEEEQTVRLNVRDMLHIITRVLGDRDRAVDAVMEILTRPDIQIPDDHMTVQITTDRGIGNELVRHRVLAYEDDMISAYTAFADDMSMVQASTRFIKYASVPIPICIPEPLPFVRGGDEWGTWITSCTESARAYKSLIEAGQTPQTARNVLPLSTATTIVMTGTIDQWKAFLRLRLDYAAHPQMRYISDLIRKLPHMMQLIPLGSLKTDEEK